MSELGKSLLLQAYVRAPCHGEQPAPEFAARSLAPRQNPVGYGECTPQAPLTILRPHRSLTSTDAVAQPFTPAYFCTLPWLGPPRPRLRQD